MPSGTTRITYLVARLVQADILDEEGRSLLSVGRESLLHPSHRPTHQLNTEDAEIKHTADVVNIHIASNRKIWAAHKLYRALRITQEECFTADSTDYLWSTHRLAGTSEILGLLKQSYDLFLIAKEGRMRVLGPEHRSFRYSAKGAERLWRHLVASGTR